VFSSASLSSSKSFNQSSSFVNILPLFDDDQIYV